MKTFALILMLMEVNGAIVLERTEKPFQSISECQAWKYQKEFHGPVRPVLAENITCMERE